MAAAKGVSKDGHGRRSSARWVALLPWGDVFEDFLDTLDVSPDSFAREFRGSWIFGYVEALRVAGMHAMIICFSSQIDKPVRFTHLPTGCSVSILPTPRLYWALRQLLQTSFGARVVERVLSKRASRAFQSALSGTILYVSTPVFRLARELRNNGCDTVLCQEYEYPRFDVCVLLGRVLGLRVFASFQGGNYHHSPLERFVRPFALRRATGLIVAPSTEHKRLDDRYGLTSLRVHRVFNPIDVNAWKPVEREHARAVLDIPQDAAVVIWHGRVSLFQKGLDVLLAAWARVVRAASMQQARLYLLGTGRDADALRARLAEFDESQVTWVDTFVHDRELVARYLSAADVYAFPSRLEGFPVAPLEAMACGLPVVAADASGIPDIFEGGEVAGGVIVPAGDVGELAAALTRCLSDVDFRLDLGWRGRRRIEARFSLEAVGEQLRAVFDGSDAEEARAFRGTVSE